MPIGMNDNNTVSVSILNGKFLSKSFGMDSVDGKVSDEILHDRFNGLLHYLKYRYEYIYIPKDIDPESFTKLETSEIQKLMGESLEQIISKSISASAINSINKGLNSFLSDLEQELGTYTYRTKGDRQQNIQKRDVYNLITKAFFRIRKLNKKHNNEWIEISSLSSGEKQRAIIDIAYGFLTNHRESGDNIILAIDEPESSLHMSACFEQFERLFLISKNTHQVLFTSHWYGYLPTVEDGCTTSIIKNDSEHSFDLYDLASYREEVRANIKSNHQSMPIDIKIKSVNDLIQSIITSCISDNHYNWIICEGTTEKKYLSHYLNDLISNKRLRIVPVGGASEVKKIYKLLEASYDEFKKHMKGKIFLLSDTDAEFINYETQRMEHIFNKRIVNKEEKTYLVDISSNPLSPQTEIEDCLNPKIFIEVLKSFLTTNPEILNIIPQLDVVDETKPSFSIMDLGPSSKKILDNFFDQKGVKYEFSKRYVESSASDNLRPQWIDLIEEFFTSDKPVKFH